MGERAEGGCLDLRLKPPLRPYVIVLGNEKGGTGKSTLAMHIVVALMRGGYSVGAIDVDGRQGTLTRYLENRERFCARQNPDNLKFQVPPFHRIRKSESDFQEQACDEEYRALSKAFHALGRQDIIVIDTPGNDTFLSREAHAHADTLITPLNDSLIDLDLFVQLESKEKNNMARLSHYAESVWEQRKVRAQRNGQPIDWIVLQNRLSHLHTKNKEHVTKIVEALARRIGFRFGGGFGERVIFRELFTDGLTVLDVEDTGASLSLSHVGARQELRLLLKMLPLEKLAPKQSQSA